MERIAAEKKSAANKKEKKEKKEKNKARRKEKKERKKEKKERKKAKKENAKEEKCNGKGQMKQYAILQIQQCRAYALVYHDRLADVATALREVASNPQYKVTTASAKDIPLPCETAWNTLVCDNADGIFTGELQRNYTAAKQALLEKNPDTPAAELLPYNFDAQQLRVMCCTCMNWKLRSILQCPVCADHEAELSKVNTAAAVANAVAKEVAEREAASMAAADRKRAVVAAAKLAETPAAKRK
jgi:hypothetical protein